MIRPLTDWLYVEPIVPASETASGLYIQQAEDQAQAMATVLAVGPKCTLAVGDVILHEKYQLRRFEVEGAEVALVREEHVCGTLDRPRESGETTA